MERTTEQSVAVIESHIDQMCARWRERAEMTRREGIAAEAFSDAIDAAIDAFRDSEHPELRLLAELAEIGWCHVLTRWGESAQVD